MLPFLADPSTSLFRVHIAARPCFAVLVRSEVCLPPSRWTTRTWTFPSNQRASRRHLIVFTRRCRPSQRARANTLYPGSALIAAPNSRPPSSLHRHHLPTGEPRNVPVHWRHSASPCPRVHRVHRERRRSAHQDLTGARPVPFVPKPHPHFAVRPRSRIVLPITPLPRGPRSTGYPPTCIPIACPQEPWSSRPTSSKRTREQLMSTSAMSISWLGSPPSFPLPAQVTERRRRRRLLKQLPARTLSSRSPRSSYPSSTAGRCSIRSSRSTSSTCLRAPALPTSPSGPSKYTVGRLLMFTGSTSRRRCPPNGILQGTGKGPNKATAKEHAARQAYELAGWNS